MRYLNVPGEKGFFFRCRLPRDFLRDFFFLLLLFNHSTKLQFSLGCAEIKIKMHFFFLFLESQSRLKKPAMPLTRQSAEVSSGMEKKKKEKINVFREPEDSQ